MAAPTILTGILTGGANSHATSSEEVNAFATDFASEGIVGTFTNTSGVAPATGAFAVNGSGSPDTNINITTGVAYVTATPTSQNSQTLRVKCSVTGTLAISANASGSTKYDWIYISVSATNAANPAVGADNVATVVASRSTSASTDDGTPPTYGYPIAVVTVANGFSTITNGNIRDVRTNSTVNLGSSSVSSGWLDLGYAPNTVTANGNRSYDLVFNSTNLTTTVSNGMKLKCSRLVTAPTQCTSLNGTTQYYSKTTPSGVTFTDDFTCMGWVKLSSYAAGGIIARRNADTEGWSLLVGATGQIQLIGLRIAANNANVLSYQSIPLNKWVHIAASLDMSGATGAIYIDGVLVPSAFSVTGTATALVQGTTALVVGAQKSDGTAPFPGKIAQAAVFSSVLSAATIRSYVSQTLSGAESTCVACFTLNNSLVDTSANANTVTAQGGALATNADSPFGIQADGTTAGTTEYAIITKTAFSTNTTLTVQVPEGNAIPTSGGVSAVSYSTQKSPYGMPAISPVQEVMLLSNFATTSTTPTQILGLTIAPFLPANVSYRLSMYSPSSSASATLRSPTLSIWNGVVASGTQLTNVQTFEETSGTGSTQLATSPVLSNTTAGVVTFNGGAFIAGGVGTLTLTNSTTQPMTLSIEVLGFY